MPQEVDPNLNKVTPADTVNLLYIATAVQSACFYPLTRYGAGSRSLRWLGPAALVWMLAVAEASRCSLMYGYLCVWVIACVFQAVLKDRTQHSRYAGFPIACRLPFVKTEAGGRVLEAFLIAVAGFALSQTDDHIAAFLVGGGICLLVRQAIEKSAGQKQAVEMRDAAIEAQHRSSVYRG